MKEKGINRILSVATVAVSLLSMNACGTTFPQYSQLSAFQTDFSGSACFADNSVAHVALLSANIISMRSMNEYLAQCREQALNVHHENNNCRAATVMSGPYDYSGTVTAT